MLPSRDSAAKVRHFPCWCRSLPRFFLLKSLTFVLLCYALLLMDILMRKMQSMQYIPSESSSLRVLAHHML